MTKFDDRTERLLLTLHPKAQPIFRTFLDRLHATGIDARIVDGSRTFKEQDALYAKGRTTPGPIVTNAKAGQSLHNFAIAVDLGIFDSHSNYLPDSPLYRKCGEIGRAMGLEWGGDWQSIQDEPHFQVRTGLSLAELRRRVAQGIDVLSGVTLPDIAPPAASVAVPTPWRVMYEGKLLGEAWANPDDDGHAYYPARALLAALGIDTVPLGWDAATKALTWQGAPLPVPCVQRDSGTVWASLRPLCTRFGFVVDAEGQTLTVRKA